MIRLFTCRALQPSNIYAIRRQINPLLCSSLCGFSAQAAKQTQQSPTFINEPCSCFNSHAYGALLQRCIQNDDPISAMGLHSEILKRGNCLDLFATNILLNMYVKAQLLSEAEILFDEMPERNTISFVTLIQGYTQSLQFVEAVGLFTRLHREGHELNPFVFTSILKVLVSMEWAELGWNFHACIYKLGHESNAFVGTALIDTYSVCGCVDFAREVFDGVRCKDMVTWTGMVACYAENDFFEEALEVFSHMRLIGFKPNNFTFAGVFKACIGLEAFDVAKGVHGCILKARYEHDIYVGVALLELYTKSGNIGNAQRVFEEIPKKDVIPWSFMISRFAQSNQSEVAVSLFCRMRRAFVVPNQFTFASALQACATMGDIELGKQMHGLVHKVGLDLDVFVSNAVMDVYAKCGRIEDSMQLFEKSINRNDVSWNIMIVGYVRCGDAVKALGLFLEMLENRVLATEVTYSSVLCASASLAALELGTQIHSLAIKTNYAKNTVVDNALIDMYSKCGRIRDARLVFDIMNERDEVSWNAMISGYSMHGLGIEALKIFQMMQDRGYKPNTLTFVGVLSACSNSGLFYQGQDYFTSMVQDYGIEPCIEHYSCMVWLLGRSGHLYKAAKLIEEIPFEPSVMVWRALLGACIIHNNVELGRLSAQRILEREPRDEATHVLLSNMYAIARRWENVSAIRQSMKKKGMKKEPGLSWVENHGRVHYFSVGDTSHPDMKVINGILEWLNMRTRRAGFVPNCHAVLLDVEDKEKEHLLWVHSERLALAFAMFRTPSGSQIRIIKNLRICVDCHAAMKLISKIVQRNIIIRDMNRFHHFQNGICSCGDYW
ncbi:Tetratricopeptide repeat-like superfamily protein [Theobroma cacao]|uniref:Tetratricopeptide repeat-like superfamily protein n=1 Tax=Theobroma cacao TaxID=3641 RepID=A0A061E420_THECC|nr:Tetratricopeptide repeat-like superfamily protein [Theobroma cacao]